MRISFFLLLSTCLLLSHCTRLSEGGDNSVIARVNGTPVTLQAFRLKYEQLKGEQDEITKKNPKIINELKLQALNEAIVFALIEQEAQKRQIAVDKEEVEGRLANWKDGYPPGGFEEMVRRQNTTEDFLKKRIEEQLLLEKVLEEAFSSETLISDEEMKKYHEEHQQEYFQPERVHVYQIVVPTVEEAQKIRQEITSGKITFQSAARKYSLSPDAAKGGDLGFFSKNEKIPAFNKAFSLSVNEVSDPIKSRYGVHLLKVVEKQIRKKLDFQQAKGDLAKNLKKMKEARVYKEWVSKLLKEGKIYRNEKLFSSI